MNNLYGSKSKKPLMVGSRIWCPCKGSCVAGCMGTCRWLTGLG